MNLLNVTQKEIDINSKIQALAFLPDEELCIVSGEESMVQLRHLGDDLMGQPIDPSTGAFAVATSRDGRWIVTGATNAFVIWKKIEDEVELVKRHDIGTVRTIDISLDSKWVVTGSDNRMIDMWDISTGERRLGSLRQEYNVVAVKFCPCGERLATATLFGSVRIYAFSSGQWQKLLTIPISVSSTLSSHNTTLVWFAHRPQLFAVSQGQIRCLNSDDGSLVYQWATRGIKHPSSVILSPNGKLIAYSINNAVVLRDTTTRQQIGDMLKLEEDVSCIAFSPQSDLLVAAAGTKLTVWNLRRLPTDPSHFVDTTHESAKSCMDHKQDLTRKPPSSTFSLPLMNISNGAVKAWLHGFLEYAEQVFTKEIDSTSVDYNTYANRALIFGRRKIGDAALKDAEKMSPIGLIAKAIAFTQQGKYELARHEISKLQQTFQTNEYAFLLEVIQSIVFCMSGDYAGEISHLNRLSRDKKGRELLLLLLVQANMHLSEKCFESAMESCNKAHMPAVFPHDETQEMWTISFIFGWKFSGLAIQIQQKKCQFLLDAGNPEAAILFVELRNTYQREIAMHVELSDWTSEFRKDCLTRLKDLGDKALESKEYKVAIQHYSAVEPLIGDPDAKHKLLLKRSEAHANIPENWMEALNDAQEAIKLDPLSPWGYDKKHVVLYARQSYHEAAEALDEMIKAVVFSKDAKSTQLREQGVDPGKTRQIVLEIVDATFSQPRPHILISTDNGRLCDKQKQIEAFRAHPQYKELILSPTSWVATESNWKYGIMEYFRYSTFSHTWENHGEPEFRDVENIPVDSLPESFPTTKLKTFCKITREHGYSWAWSDTCCINKADKNVLDMSLRSMYSWYSASVLTIVHLKGVLDNLEPGLNVLLDELLRQFVECRWNERAWTLQEYFASRVIHFYTEDWKPYLPIDYPRTNTDPTNHKYHDAIQRGMELVTGLDPTRLTTLKPGSGDVREKLRLASTRKATKREDTAYSLLGIFRLTLQAIYGDDEAPLALGRLLGALLTKSADVTILDWVGERSEYNTCLPAEITVYKSSQCLHIPNQISEKDLARSVSAMSPMDIESAMKLHDRLLDTLPPELVHGRLKLPCISFPLSLITRDPISGRYTATVELLEKVEFATEEDLSDAQSMFLVHPWYRCLLGPGIPLTNSERRESALRLLASLREPFGALLLAWTARGYERMAADKLIRVAIRKDVPAEKLMENIRMLNIC